jgi:ATP-binding protein involved in chromosome partitioning
MAWFAAGGARVPIFGEGGARREADRLGVPFLGEVPIDIDLRRGGDDGRPLLVSDPGSATAKVFANMAAALAP